AWLNLVRFDTGDLVRPATTPCACGKPGLTLEAVEGRSKDCLLRENGQLVTVRAIDRALAPIAGLLHYRVVQKSARDAELELVPDGFDPLDPASAADAVASVLGVRPRERVVARVP